MLFLYRYKESADDFMNLLNGGEEPNEDEVFCFTPECFDKPIAVIPGVCSPQDRELMLMVDNDALNL